jgi:hypothetical protein
MKITFWFHIYFLDILFLAYFHSVKHITREIVIKNLFYKQPKKYQVIKVLILSFYNIIFLSRSFGCN